MKPILPPAMLGILGGGQLGRMFAVAAKTMGYQVMVLEPDPLAPAAKFADRHLCTSYDDPEALKTLARQCAAVTTEFENVSAQAMALLAQNTRVSPSGKTVAIAQNRIEEKHWINQAGLATAPYAPITCKDDLVSDINQNLFPAILKTACLGYDGKGQVIVNNYNELVAAFEQLHQVPCVLEKRLPLQTEISVIVTRIDSGEAKCFPVAENQHKNGILDVSIVPARVSLSCQQQAQQMALCLAEKLDYVGVLAVELFVLDDDSLVVNEIAPRPHNSGHYTLDACSSDQFTQQVRAMCGLPPAGTTLLSPCVMVNILGNKWAEDGSEPDWLPLMSSSSTHLHLYGKKQARAGRKMGHFTVLADDNTAALTEALNLQSSF